MHEGSMVEHMREDSCCNFNVFSLIRRNSAKLCSPPSEYTDGGFPLYMKYIDKNEVNEIFPSGF